MQGDDDRISPGGPAFDDLGLRQVGGINVCQTEELPSSVKIAAALGFLRLQNSFSCFPRYKSVYFGSVTALPSEVFSRALS